MSQISLGQNEQYTELDSTESAGITYYRLLVGQLENRKKEGLFQVYQYSSVDTNQNLTWKGTYRKDQLQSDELITLEGKCERIYGKNERVEKETYSRYGNKVYQYDYKSRKSRITQTFYANGQVSGIGEEVLVRITQGGDAGMKVFTKDGRWTYFDISGEKIDEREHRISEGPFKKR